MVEMAVLAAPVDLWAMGRTGARKANRRGRPIGSRSEWVMF